jgi:hypothetical protein
VTSGASTASSGEWLITLLQVHEDHRDRSKAGDRAAVVIGAVARVIQFADVAVGEQHGLRRPVADERQSVPGQKAILLVT